MQQTALDKIINDAALHAEICGQLMQADYALGALSSSSRHLGHLPFGLPWSLGSPIKPTTTEEVVTNNSQLMGTIGC